MVRPLFLFRCLLLQLLLLVGTFWSARAQTSCSSDLAQGLQLWLPFEESNGDRAIDASGHARAGQLTGGTWLPTGGHDGHGALALTGAESVFIPFATTPSAFSVAFWVLPTALSDWNTFVGAKVDLSYVDANGNANPWGGFVLHTTAQGQVYTGTADLEANHWLIAPAGTMQVQQWQHYVFTFDQGTGCLYRNGTLLLRREGLPLPQPWQGVLIGGSRLTTPCPFQGSIDELRVYDRALPAAQVQALAACAAPASPPSPAPPALAANRPDDTNQGLALRQPHLPLDSAATQPADLNYVRSWSPRVALTQAERVTQAPVDSVALSTQYLDGLGRPLQTVLRQASPQRRDLVQPQAYDALGREPRQYLPYPDSTGGHGGYRYQALTQQQRFYAPAGTLGPPTADDPTRSVARTGVAYAETQFEASPLNQVLAQGAPGEAWQLAAGHALHRLERPNVAMDSVLSFQPGYDPHSLEPGYQGFYPDGALWGTQTTDEHGSRAIEWKDKLGQVVLKQVESSRPDTSRLAKRRWLRTCYVYDDFQHLRFVLQPAGVQALLRPVAPTAPLPAGLLAWLPLNQPQGGQAVDQSGNGRAGALSGGRWTASASEVPAHALHLQGSDQLRVPLALTPTAFTVAFWTNPDQLREAGNFVGARVAGVVADGQANPWGGFVFHTMADGRVYTGTQSGGSSRWLVAPAGTMQAGQWQHYVFTYEPGTGIGSLYRNGALLVQHDGLPQPQAWEELLVGGAALNSALQYQGRLAELRVYERSLSAADVRTLYQGALGSSGPATVAPFLFHYRYDGRGRQVAKQVPGQDGETLVVYDQLDRPVLSQDAQQRTRKEWNWTKYDALGRMVLSGLVSRADTMGQVRLQALATADTATAHQYEQRTASLGQYPHGLTTDQSFPKLGQQGFSKGQVLTVTYYDDYDFDNNGQADLSYNTSTDSQFPSGQAPVADALRTKGMSTRTKTRVLGVAENDRDQAAWLTTTTFYDERARPVQVQTSNARKNPDTGQVYTDLLTTQLDFMGKVVQSVTVHQGPTLSTPLQVAEFFTYDHTGRLLTTRQQVPGEAQPTQVATVQYNELGQVTRKTLGTGRLKQDVDYAYNIRGWLTKLNDPAQPDPADLFNLSLHYETGFTKGYEQYNGNLTGQTWRGRDGVQRAYGYIYDPLNRILQGDFVARAGGSQGTLSSGTAWNQEMDNYRLSFVSYDDNGNINTLRRRGLLQNATSKVAKQYGAVDNLSYAYVGNRLQAVDDAVTGNQLAKPATYHGAPTSLAGDFQEASIKLSQEYLYDANGNLTQDKNKGITGIKYNHLNLPRQIQFGSGADSVVFLYTASGQKVAKLVYQMGQNKPQRTDYLGPYQYEQDSLKFFPHAEGRVLRLVSYDPAGQATVSYQREYTIKDHLGNLRLAYRLGQPRTLLATLEQDDATHKREYQQFDSLSVSPPIAVAAPHAISQYAARLNAGGSVPQPLGPLTQLGVQKGDVLTISAMGFYPQAPDHGFFFSLASFLTSLFHPAQPAPVGMEVTKRKNLPLLQLGVAAGLTSLTRTSGVPLGYLRVLVFNKDSVLVQEQTKQVQLSSLANKGYEQLSTQLVLAQDGYVTAYVGNESNVDVFFDDVRVEHQPGLQVQENQYDPWGMNLVGLDYITPRTKLLNHYQYNGQEYQSDLGLSLLHYGARFYNPAIARWLTIDPLAEISRKWSPYNYTLNNPVNNTDPDGMWTETVNGYRSDSPEEAQALFGILREKQSGPGNKNKRESKKEDDAIHNIRGGPMGANMTQEERAEYNKGNASGVLGYLVGEGIGLVIKPFIGPAAAWLTRLSGPTVEFSAAETAVISQAKTILKSQNLIKQAFASGVGTELKLAGKTILVEPEFPASGMTLFGEDGFVIGKEAFASQEEFTKTILHELYRLENSARGATGAAKAAQETQAAAAFAEKAYGGVFK
jgi:RHS repeat-associated protein